MNGRDATAETLGIEGPEFQGGRERAFEDVYDAYIESARAIFRSQEVDLEGSSPPAEAEAIDYEKEQASRLVADTVEQEGLPEGGFLDNRLQDGFVGVMSRLVKLSLRAEARGLKIEPFPQLFKDIKLFEDIKQGVRKRMFSDYYEIAYLLAPKSQPSKYHYMKSPVLYQSPERIRKIKKEPSDLTAHETARLIMNCSADPETAIAGVKRAIGEVLKEFPDLPPEMVRRLVAANRNHYRAVVIREANKLGFNLEVEQDSDLTPGAIGKLAVDSPEAPETTVDQLQETPANNNGELEKAEAIIVNFKEPDPKGAISDIEQRKHSQNGKRPGLPSSIGALVLEARPNPDPNYWEKMPKTEEVHLLSMARSGNEELATAARWKFFSIYQPYAIILTKKFKDSWGDYEEELHDNEALIFKCIDAIPDYKRGGFSSYYYNAVKNAALRRKAEKARESPAPTPLDETIQRWGIKDHENFGLLDQPLDSTVFEKDIMNHELLRDLPKRQRQVMWLRVYAKLHTTKEIAEVMGCSEKAVSMLEHRARKTMSNDPRAKEFLD